jgi:hypothetical protein
VGEIMTIDQSIFIWAGVGRISFGESF